MKIGIVTIHHAKYSYGAVLQAIAMCRICQRWSDYVEIINYENKYEQKDIKLLNSSFLKKISVFTNYITRHILFGAWKNPYRNKKNLDNIYKCVTKEKFYCISQMKRLNYDILICGSDQIWNPQIMNGVDPVFFLDFGNAKRRVAYAASMGSYILKASDKIEFSKYLSNFSSISVREEHAKNQLQKLTNKKISINVDPTLLLSSLEWDKELNIENDSILDKQKYILTFFVWNGFSTYQKDVNKYAKALDLPIWNVQSHSYKAKGVDKVIQAPTVNRFVQLLKNATLVITNSFHGVAFSINYNKPFVPIINAMNPARVMGLLRELDIENGIGIAPDRVFNYINYSKVNVHLDVMRKDSIIWLENAIKGNFS
ncbi:hypothetical protein SDC9_16523 [bioreactor metagenome]|uniref:Polysaccharide pyruvyl transferase domain-containing protein n=1 Tax=bioreactor metagenome TaxID=1076179 RepID=A0A644TX33_9ZZZZ